MRPERSVIKRVASKEITLFFSSPIAYLFLASFAAVTLFVFFWGEAFFARNIADVRPMFEWMPLLLVFLASTLTMRLWSEERRTGTVEHVMTLPVPLWHFVVGKFLGCLALLGIALLITLPLPLSVAFVGDLDWGPVWAGYIATFLLGAAYLSIGLFVSARSDNQIISLLCSVAVCGGFYLVGTPMLTELFTTQTAEWLRAIGTSSRFEDIARGVLDLRDLAYYLGLIATFLTLNTLALEAERWSQSSSLGHGQWRGVTFLIIANAIVANLWLGQLQTLRIDVTEGRQYSISEPTLATLAQVREPLRIRGYFSSKTHPLLAPLVPQLKDLLKEYAIAGGGQIRVEFIDPAEEPDKEQEANQEYAIKPVPFQVADRYQSAIVSSYFHILIEYGSEHEILTFEDLIEVKVEQGTDLEVRLRNPEYDLTRTIKKVLDQYQAEGNLFDAVQGKLGLTVYVSADEKLPNQLKAFKRTLETVVNEMVERSGDRLSVEFIDPEANGGEVAEQILSKYGFQPMVMDMASQQTFYFYLTIGRDDQLLQIPLGNLTEPDLKRNLEAGVKRFARGFTKTIALAGANIEELAELQSSLGKEHNLVQELLEDGSVAGTADLLLVVAPDNLDEKEVFAIDQFLMQGGTVIMATSPFSANVSRTALTVESKPSGLKEWLAHNGVTIGETLVLDPQCSALTVPVTRTVQGYQFQEYALLEYPYFIDVRESGLSQDSPITSELRQVVVPYASPMTVDETTRGQREVTELLRTSSGAWVSATTDVKPIVDSRGASAYLPEGAQTSHLVGVATTGRFESFFAEKTSPLQQGSTVPASVLKHSPDSARLIVFSSKELLRDQMLQLASAASGSRQMGSLEMVINAVDWALQDTELLSIRSRSHFNRTLPLLSKKTQLVLEYLNYVLAGLALLFVGLLRWWYAGNRRRAYAQILDS